MKRARLFIAAGIVVAALLYLIVGGIRSSIVYYVTPSELLAQKAAVGKSLRLGGQVAPGSRQWNPTTLELSFILTDGTASVPVYHQGAPPDLFTEGQGAVVEGSFGADGLFRARSIIVKHSEQYAPPDERGR